LNLALPGEDPALPGRRNAFAVALGISLFLHALFLLALQSVDLDLDSPHPQPLTAELRPPPAPPAAKEKRPLSKPVPPPIKAKSPDIAPQQSAPVPSESVEAVPQTEVSAAGEAAPAGAASPPAENAAAAPVIAEAVREKLDPALVGRYGIAVACALKRHRSYPVFAAKNEWSGTVRMQLRVGRSGELREVRVIASSGHTYLDEHAVDTLRKAYADIAVPQRLIGHEFHVDQAIIYDMSGLDQGPTPGACPKP
jgi:TonB family protein